MAREQARNSESFFTGFHAEARHEQIRAINILGKSWGSYTKRNRAFQTDNADDNEIPYNG